MKKILVASHGHLASGVKSVAKILLRDDSAITAVDCYVDETDPHEKIQAFFDELDPEDDAIVFTDLLGGSVCNMVTMMKPSNYGAIHVTGFNLAVVLECLISPDPFTPQMVDAVLETGSGLMMRVEVDDSCDAVDEEGDFFE